MDIEKLIEDLHGILKQYGEKIPYGELVGAPWPYSRAGDLVWPDPEPYFIEQAATALSTLQAENEKLRAELEQAKAERDAAIEDIDSILAKAELIRRKIGYCLDYDSDAELASLCVNYCKNNVCEMCYEEREDGGCGNFLWRSQKEG